MEIIILPSPAEVGKLAARRIAQLIQRNPATVLGLATGSSPLAIYAELAGQVRAGQLEVSRVRGFALDEYVGIPPGHPQSYASVIHREVVEPLGLDPSGVRVPDGLVGAAVLVLRYAGIEVGATLFDTLREGIAARSV